MTHEIIKFAHNYIYDSRDNEIHTFNSVGLSCGGVTLEHGPSLAPHVAHPLGEEAIVPTDCFTSCQHYGGEGRGGKGRGGEVRGGVEVRTLKYISMYTSGN